MSKTNRKNIVSAGPVAQCVTGVDCTDITLMNAKYYSIRHFTFPLPATEVARQFPAEFDLFTPTSNPSAQAPGVVFDSNLVLGQEVPGPFLLCGFCIHIDVEPETYTVSGSEFNFTPGTTPAVDPPASSGVNILGTPQAPAPAFNASLEVGSAAWRWAVAMLQAYNLSFTVQSKYELFNISLSEIGCVTTPGETQAVGDSTRAASHDIARANAHYWEIGSGRQFLPPTAQAPTPGGQLTDQAFQSTARSKFGNLKSTGAGFYSMINPIALAPCCRINASLIKSGESANSIDRNVQHDIVLREALDNPLVPFGGAWTGTVAGATTGTALARTMKIANASIGVVMLGYDMTSKACGEWVRGGNLSPELQAILDGLGMGAMKLSLPDRQQQRFSRRSTPTPSPAPTGAGRAGERRLPFPPFAVQKPHPVTEAQPPHEQQDPLARPHESHRRYCSL